MSDKETEVGLCEFTQLDSFQMLSQLNSLKGFLVANGKLETYWKVMREMQVILTKQYEDELNKIIAEKNSKL